MTQISCSVAIKMIWTISMQIYRKMILLLTVKKKISRHKIQKTLKKMQKMKQKFYPWNLLLQLIMIKISRSLLQQVKFKMKLISKWRIQKVKQYSWLINLLMKKKRILSQLKMNKLLLIMNLFSQIKLKILLLTSFNKKNLKILKKM